MLHRLGVDSIIYGGASLAVRGLQIFLIPIYSRVLGLDDYGVIETIAIAGALVNLTVALEISQGMARHIADTPDDLVRRAFASTAIGFAVFAYAAFFLIVAAFADGLAPWLLVGKTPPQTLVVAAAAIAVNGVFAIVQDLLRWQLRPWFYAMASFAYASGSAGVGIWLVELEGAGVVGVFWGQLAGASLGLGISLWYRAFTALSSATVVGRRFSLSLVL
jgi:O-antigen/teichoic acid export membrane protein